MDAVEAPVWDELTGAALTGPAAALPAAHPLPPGEGGGEGPRIGPRSRPRAPHPTLSQGERAEHERACKREKVLKDKLEASEAKLRMRERELFARKSERSPGARRRQEAPEPATGARNPRGHPRGSPGHGRVGANLVFAPLWANTRFAPTPSRRNGSSWRRRNAGVLVAACRSWRRGAGFRSEPRRLRSGQCAGEPLPGRSVTVAARVWGAAVGAGGTGGRAGVRTCRRRSRRRCRPS